MTHHRNNVAYSVLLGAMLSGIFGARYSAQQSETASTQKDKLLEAKVHEFKLNNETLLDGLWQLARLPVPFGFGFEGVLKGSSADPETQDPRFTLDLKDQSAREILDALCRADSRYMWLMDGATVNVFPKNVLRDSSYLLNRKLDTFELRNATDVDDGLLGITRQLPPPTEQVAHMQFSGDDSYPPKPWTVTYHNLTVREVVNRLAEHGGPCAAWTFGGSRDFRRFAFFNNLRCSPKQSPAWIQKIVESRPKSLNNNRMLLCEHGEEEKD